MRERPHQIGGKFTITSKPNFGTRIEATTPMLEPWSPLPKSKYRSDSVAHPLLAIDRANSNAIVATELLWKGRLTRTALHGKLYQSPLSDLPLSKT
jgi:hypothetical protein